MKTQKTSSIIKTCCLSLVLLIVFSGQVMADGWIIGDRKPEPTPTPTPYSSMTTEFIPVSEDSDEAAFPMVESAIIFYDIFLSHI